MIQMTMLKRFALAGAAVAALGLTACQNGAEEPATTTTAETGGGGLFGGGWFGAGQERNAEARAEGSAPTYAALDEDAQGLGVNALLWRSALDTLAFMPLSSADPFGGVIITDWYQPPESPGERFKLTVYILDKRLRADGLQVNVFRQERDELNAWQDALVTPDTRISIENAILTRARQLRLNSVED
jgi:hypothetical protein